jgi:hypothetical protein
MSLGPPLTSTAAADLIRLTTVSVSRLPDQLPLKSGKNQLLTFWSHLKMDFATIHSKIPRREADGDQEGHCRASASRVVTGDLPTPGRAARIGEVLSGLPGRCGNGEIFAWTDPGDAGMLPAVLFARISRAGLFEDWPAGVGIDAACDPVGLMTRLWEIDEAAATGTLAGLASVSMAYAGGERDGVGGVVDGGQYLAEVGWGGGEAGRGPGGGAVRWGGCPLGVGEGESAEPDDQVAGVGDGQ